MQKHGEVSWQDTPTDNTSKKNAKDLFLKLNPGSNVIRVITAPYQFYQHRYKVSERDKFGNRINCSAANGACPVCEKGDKPKRRWLIGVIDRKTGSYKILDIGFSIFKAIQTLTNDDDWGTPDKYDIDVVVDPHGGATGYYSVVSKPPKPLTASDLKVRDDNDPDVLAQRTVPPTYEQVLERLNRLQQAANQGGDMTTGSKTSLASTMDEEEDMDFKDYDKEQENELPF